MKTLLFVTDMIVTGIVEYFCAKYILFGTYLENAKILSLYSPEEKAENLFWFLLPSVILLIIQFVFCLFGKKLVRFWNGKDKTLFMVCSVIVTLSIYAGYVFLHP